MSFLHILELTPSFHLDRHRKHRHVYMILYKTRRGCPLEKPYCFILLLSEMVAIRDVRQ